MIETIRKLIEALGPLVDTLGSILIVLFMSSKLVQKWQVVKNEGHREDLRQVMRFLNDNYAIKSIAKQEKMHKGQAKVLIKKFIDNLQSSDVGIELVALGRDADYTLEYIESDRYLDIDKMRMIHEFDNSFEQTRKQYQRQLGVLEPVIKSMKTEYENIMFVLMWSTVISFVCILAASFIWDNVPVVHQTDSIANLFYLYFVIFTLLCLFVMLMAGYLAIAFMIEFLWSAFLCSSVPRGLIPLWKLVDWVTNHVLTRRKVEWVDVPHTEWREKVVHKTGCFCFAWVFIFVFGIAMGMIFKKHMASIIAGTGILGLVCMAAILYLSTNQYERDQAYLIAEGKVDPTEGDVKPPKEKHHGSTK
ncbi:hypothetical protein JOC36_001518 [Weissella uvarum]|uniref:hypothetical protein n=1 Tax=Weissella uvarum TaxID=1479233 RepID=UPI00195FB686|nr:hypothetical protein [Weissella uvarum]MBM7617925.1 hypothetical protein [Weissella uvarum]MCM0596079.1 hypothetical protein [Weissella uvarum]